MKRLHQFILKSFLGPFVMTFFICVFILLMQFLWKYVDDMVGKGLEWNIIVELLIYASFALIPLAFPLAMLLASIMTFGSLGENYELVAIKASGISLFRTMRPLFLVAILLTMLAFYFANNILPVTNLKFYELMGSVKRQKPEMVIKEGVFTNDIDGFSIRVERKSKTSNMLYKILIYDHRTKKGNVEVTIADSGTMKISEDKKFMVLTLYDGQTSTDIDESKVRAKDRRYPFRRNQFKKEIINIDLKGFDFQRVDGNIYRNSYRMLNIGQLNHFEDSLNTDYKLRVRRFALGLHYNKPTNRELVNLTQPIDSLKLDLNFKADSIVDYASILASLNKIEQNEVLRAAISQARNNLQQIDQNEIQLYNQKKILNKYSMEKHRKFTLSVACLIFFFIGAPLGAIIRKGGLGMPVVVSILLFITYYMVSISGEKFAREDVWSMFKGMWFSTLIFLPIGLYLTYKAANDSGMMNIETYQYNIKRFINFIFFRKKSHEEAGNENSSTDQ
ncbi:LptF/LptG family permease [Sunxiuqinia sp. A32]|uniref:LptF/LptG family permease n=1 Tax=Sunxiuqinia sp. A32 TaxID=3461496 RepID=UPI0040457BA9